MRVKRAASAQRIAHAADFKRKLYNFFLLRASVNPVEKRNAHPGKVFRYRFVCGKHIFFDNTVGKCAPFGLHSNGLPFAVSCHMRFGKIEIDRAASVAYGMPQLCQLAHCLQVL